MFRDVACSCRLSGLVKYETKARLTHDEAEITDPAFEQNEKLQGYILF